MDRLLHVEVLGPLRARDADGTDCTPDGLLQRRLLATLVLHRGTTVSPDTAIEAMWPGDQRPKDPVAALQTHLFRLRRALPAGVIESTGTGYRLDPTVVGVDVDDLASALHDDHHDPLAAAAIAATLDRWHGPAYPDLADDDAGRAEAARLEELRVLAAERLAEARLERGPADGLVADLQALVDEHPLRERPVALLVDALHASGRTAEALRAYDDLRRRLGEELGIEPSAALAARHAELLAGGPGAADAEPAGTAPWVPQHRLPSATTSLVGREQLAADATALTDQHRLVTLLGFGGVGKTRLLLEVGARLRTARADRPVVLCELATASPESAVDVVTAALAIDGRPGVGLAERLANVLADTELVLLLDNCEHVLEPVAELAERLLARCPRVTMVATSRERLRVPGEQLCPIVPLPIDGADDAAERLFVERARSVRPDFEPTDDDRACIAEIVRRLDGLPLAIELAAARLHTLEVAEVAAGLDRRFRILDSGSRTTARHRSLGAAVSWSASLLDEDLRRTFVDLSVFAGAFDLRGAAAVAGLGEADAATALDQLIERSLVTRASGRRYALLETLRAYGAEQLDAEERSGIAHRRHAEHSVAWLESTEASVGDPTREAVLLEVDEALPELRTALDWLLDDGDLEWAGRLVTGLEDYAFLRLRPDVLAWSERVTAADPDDAGPLADAVWAVSALAAWMAGDVVETGVRARHAADISRTAGRPEPPAVASILGSHALFEGRLDDAAHWYREAAGRARAVGDEVRWIVCSASELLALGYRGHLDAEIRADELLAELEGLTGPQAAYAWYCAGEVDLGGDLERARQRFAVALDLAERSSAAFVSGVAGASSASIEARIGDPHSAAEIYRRLLTHWRRAGMWSTQWTMLRSVASLLEVLGRPEAAAVLAGAVVATHAGHRIFGEDEATLTRLGERLRATLGDEGYTAALQRGATLDGEAAVEHALASL